MAPNGMMEVWTGLLLRTQNEAQLAAVVGHEYTHFHNRHSLKIFREVRGKTNAASWINLIPFAGVISLGILMSVFDYSRDQEREADDGGLQRMAAAGYDTRQAAFVWEQLRAEMDATALVRKTKSRKDKDRGLFETHPPTAERVADLTALAKKFPGVQGETGSDRYRAAMSGFWPTFVDDQIKLNDFGGTEFLLAAMASGGWTPQLLYARGELFRRRGANEDLEKAKVFYTDAINGGSEIAELWRGRGLSLEKLGRHDEAKADLNEYLRRAPNATDKSMIQILTGV
jgi:tetratricopeptide (TPR) repeat protein